MIVIASVNVIVSGCSRPSGRMLEAVGGGTPHRHCPGDDARDLARSTHSHRQPTFRQNRVFQEFHPGSRFLGLHHRRIFAKCQLLVSMRKTGIWTWATKRVMLWRPLGPGHRRDAGRFV